MLTPIPDREAAALLGKSYKAIRNAVKNGVLTRLPMAGQVQHVVKEQVLLFSNKTRITLDALSPDELQAWQRYRDEVSQPQSSIVNDDIIDEKIRQRLAMMLAPLIGLSPSRLQELIEERNESDRPLVPTKI